MAPQSEQRFYFCEIVMEETETLVAAAAMASTVSVLSYVRFVIVYKSGEENNISQKYAGYDI
jgi:hypothetical protein